MLKKLLVLAAVLLITAVLSVPAFAQTTETSDLGGIFSAESCPVLQQDPTVYDLTVSMFPSLAETCGTTESV